MTKHLLLSLGLLLSLSAVSQPTIVKRNDSYYVMDEEKATKIPYHFLSKDLRHVDTSKLVRMLQGGHGYLRLSQKSNGQYGLDISVRGEGGGIGGATVGAWFGKAVVSVVGHGAIALIGAGVGLVATPAVGVATVYALEGTFGAAIETASLAGAIGCGILGGVASGPA